MTMLILTEQCAERPYIWRKCACAFYVKYLVLKTKIQPPAQLRYRDICKANRDFVERSHPYFQVSKCPSKHKGMLM